jgi:DnaJ-class molecular chaperone
MKLNEGEVLCDNCNGSGESLFPYQALKKECTKCQGDGKLDWVEAVVGKKPKPFGFSMHTQYALMGVLKPNCIISSTVS